ncbi:hypothetical protein [Arthrobacter sp. GMC3]|uniref:hypothetical protein n=1 Tax=Arthrobacter sp. GMC3 TaxID=2058894 RepID=UPI000CE3AFD0|nr:hypothetical protein [Arthrobacter sp. GMC3]
MSQHNSTPSAAEAQELLAKAQDIGAKAISSAGWPTAMVFNSFAILGSMLMIGFQIVAHTGYGAPLLAITAGVWFAVTGSTWSLMHRTTKAGFSKRFGTSLAAYMGLYVIAIFVGAYGFPNGNLAYYLSAAVVLAAVGLAAAFRELRA